MNLTIHRPFTLLKDRVSASSTAINVEEPNLDVDVLTVIIEIFGY